MSLRPGPKTSYLYPDINWRDAVKDARKKAARDPRGSNGLQMICPFPGCETSDPLIQFTHPRTGHEIYACQFHWRMCQKEAKEMSWRNQTLTSFLREISADHDGTLKFAMIGAPTNAN